MLLLILPLLLECTAASFHRPHAFRSSKSPFDWHRVPDSSYEVVHNHEVLYTIPKAPLKGVLIVLPACDTFVVEWGFASHGCQHCTGMPEEMQVLYHAMTRKYAVLVVGPDLSGTSSFCYEKAWPPESNTEIAGLRRVLRLVMDERGWWRLPRYLLGTSAGGSTAMILAARFPVQAVGSMLLGIRPDEMMETESLVAWNPDQEDEPRFKWPYPPVVILGAAHDYHWYKARINSSMEFFMRQGVLAQHIMMEPYALHPLSFSHAMPGVDPVTSASVYARLQEAGLIDSQGWGLYPKEKDETTREPADIRNATEKVLAILVAHFGPGLNRQHGLHGGHERAFTKLLYTAQAFHETRAREIGQVFDFFERHGVPDKEHIADSTSDLVWQQESNAEQIHRLAGHLPGRCILPQPARHIYT